MLFIDTLTKVLRLRPIGFDRRMEEALAGIVLEIVPVETGATAPLAPAVPASITDFFFQTDAAGTVLKDKEGKALHRNEFLDLKRRADLFDYNVFTLGANMRAEGMTPELAAPLADMLVAQRPALDAQVEVMAQHVELLISDIEETSRSSVRYSRPTPPEIPAAARITRPSLPKVTMAARHPSAVTGKTIPGMPAASLTAAM
jgi:hypothetical protein